MIITTESFCHELTTIAGCSLYRSNLALERNHLILVNIVRIGLNWSCEAVYRLIKERKLDRIEIIESIQRSRNEATVGAEIAHVQLHLFSLTCSWMRFLVMYSKRIHIQQAHTLILVDIPRRRKRVS